MTELQDKIARFENMASADPTNDMAHFSLGSAYFEAQRFDDAVTSFQTCISLNEEMTRAMELAGSALLQLGKIDEANLLLTRGYKQAAAKGEMRVKDGIATAMNAAGLEIPSVESTTITSAGKPLAHPPLPGAVGQWIFENVNEDVWDVWIGQGTKVINELRLDFSREEDQQSYEDYMIEFLCIPSEIVEIDRKAETK